MPRTTHSGGAVTAFGPSASAHDVGVLGSSMHWIESSADGSPIVFIHGNPTSSFIWRKVFSQVADMGHRLLAVDLIGFGDSGKPDIEYSLADHERYLDAWFDALDLRDVTLVLQDFGTLLGISWARRHSDRMKALVFMEPVIRVLHAAELEGVAGHWADQLLPEIRKPGVGEKMIIEDNLFVEQFIPNGRVHELTDEEMATYRAPFQTVESRRPILIFPRAVPMDEWLPGDTMAILEPNSKWLTTSPVPKLFLTFEPGFTLTQQLLDWCTSEMPNLKVQACGEGVHWVQEDQPEAVASAIRAWLPTAE